MEVIVTVGIAVAIVATTAALAPAITPSVYAQNKSVNVTKQYSEMVKFAESCACIITVRTALGQGQLLIQGSQASSFKRRISSNVSIGHLPKFGWTKAKNGTSVDKNR